MIVNKWFCWDVREESEWVNFEKWDYFISVKRRKRKIEGKKGKEDKYNNKFLFFISVIRSLISKERYFIKEGEGYLK